MKVENKLATGIVLVGLTMWVFLVILDGVL
jgi:hypothetical protein